MLSPAYLFLEAWDVGRRLSGPVVSNLMLPDEQFIYQVNLALQISNQELSYAKLKVLWDNDGTGSAKGRTLVILRQIDSFFERIHPRSLLVGGMFDDITLDHWIRKLKIHRSRTGSYSSNGSSQVIAKGPLTRGPRDEFASSAYSFADQFNFLSVAPIQLENNSMPIRISIVSKNMGVTRGLGPSPSSGTEKIVFIPVAQLSEHLHIEQRVLKGQYFADFSLAKMLDAAEIINSNINVVGYADVVMAPECVVNEQAADRLQRHMRQNPGRLRILIAGSGNTCSSGGEIPWNESRVINGAGSELWRQRKVWQAGLDKDRAAAFGINVPETGLVMEDNQAGTEIVIADIDGFGRSIILICQDLKTTPLANELMRIFQPDWVFVPILDSGAGVSRWAHIQAYELSALSPARFLIASSTALAHQTQRADAPCGLAIGPRDAIGPDAGRQLATTQCHDLPHGHGIITWRAGLWMKTNIGSDSRS